MGKDKKSKSAEKKLRVAQKTEKKAAQKEKKASKKPKDQLDDSDADDEDIDAVLAAYAKQQELFLKVTEDVCDPPSARASSTIVASPASSNELFLFGGELFNGSTARFFNDLHIYNISRDEWRLVTSPNSPLPRSGHAWTRGGNAGGIYLFGGEFSSPKQGTFYHYSDFWRLDPQSREWTKLEHTNSGKGSSKTPTAPSARSGHRMTYFKNYIILFGGFQDTSSSTKYLNDLWIYDCNNFSWHSPVLPPASGRPEARSSFTILPRDDGAVLYGGYSRVKTAALAKNASGKTSKGGPAQTSTALKPMVHQDAWYLRITPPSAESPAGTLPICRWERRKRPVNAPQPPRAGATMAFHRGRGIQFGGVHDVENSEEGIESEFFNTLYVWNIERNRFFSLALRRPRAGAKKAVAERPKRGRGKADEEELLANLKKLEMKGIVGEDAEHGLGSGADETQEEDDADEAKIEKPVFWEMPHPRFNAQLTIQNDVLFIFGGTFEKADREFTFDEMWSIDLGSLAGAKQHFKRELDDWQGSESESDEDEDEEDGEDQSGDENEDGTENASETTVPPLAADTEDVAASEAGTSVADIAEESLAPADDRPQPRPFESLREFYARTSQQWQERLLEEIKASGDQLGSSIKEMRKSAFSMAETKWWDSREEIQALEDEQEEAGIGEVVNLAEKNTDATTGAGRRR